MLGVTCAAELDGKTAEICYSRLCRGSKAVVPHELWFYNNVMSCCRHAVSAMARSEEHSEASSAPRHLVVVCEPVSSG